MTAREHTRAMLRWWTQALVLRADLAVRRKQGAMLWHYDLPLECLPLRWTGAENARRADIYIRPARGYSWPLVFLDDVPQTVADRIARKYAALVVRTSTQGGCHIWLRCRSTLDEAERRAAQQWLADRVGADRGSISGEHLGRLAGFKNWKRGGTWVNVLNGSATFPSDTAPSWDPAVVLTRRSAAEAESPGHAVSKRPTRTAFGHDTSESGKEWGWVCGRLEAGHDPDLVYERLVERARQRRGRDAERYARRTLDRALAYHSTSGRTPGRTA